MRTGPKMGTKKMTFLGGSEECSDVVTLDTDSRVCIRVKILSTMPSVADSTGTKLRGKSAAYRMGATYLPPDLTHKLDDSNLQIR